MDTLCDISVTKSQEDKTICNTMIYYTSPLNASFLIEELKRNAKDEKTPVIIVLLDTKSAFDVVDLYHLLRRLYQTGINDIL